MNKETVPHKTIITTRRISKLICQATQLYSWLIRLKSRQSRYHLHHFRQELDLKLASGEPVHIIIPAKDSWEEQ